MTLDARQDCYFFMTAECNKGEQCTFRHSEKAKETINVCEEWMKAQNCTKEDCTLRHSTFHLAQQQKPVQVNRAETNCYWEKNGGCLKPDCPFKHDLERPDFSNLPVPPPTRPFRPRADYGYGRPNMYGPPNQYMYYQGYPQHYIPPQYPQRPRPHHNQRPEQDFQGRSRPHVNVAINPNFKHGPRPVYEDFNHEENGQYSNVKKNQRKDQMQIKGQSNTRLTRPARPNGNTQVQNKNIRPKVDSKPIENRLSNKKIESTEEKKDFKIKTLSEILAEKKRKAGESSTEVSPNLDTKNIDTVITKKAKVDSNKAEEINFKVKPVEDSLEEFEEFPDLDFEPDKNLEMDPDQLDEFEKEIADISAL